MTVWNDRGWSACGRARFKCDISKSVKAVKFLINHWNLQWTSPTLERPWWCMNEAFNIACNANYPETTLLLAICCIIDLSSWIVMRSTVHMHKLLHRLGCICHMWSCSVWNEQAAVAAGETERKASNRPSVAQTALSLQNKNGKKWELKRKRHKAKELKSRRMEIKTENLPQSFHLPACFSSTVPVVRCRCQDRANCKQTENFSFLKIKIRVGNGGIDAAKSRESVGFNLDGTWQRLISGVCGNVYKNYHLRCIMIIESYSRCTSQNNPPENFISVTIPDDW